MLVDVSFITYNSYFDEETEEARVKIHRYVQLKKKIDSNCGEGDNEDGDTEWPTNGEEGPTASNVRALGIKSVKVIGYESDYMDYSNHRSYEDTSEGSDADDTRRQRLRKNCYDTNALLEDFFLGLHFQDLKLFKGELVEFSTRRWFKFNYIKNDAVRVRAKYFAKGCKWLILCSWWNNGKTYIVKHYMADHSCLLGATINRRVTASMVTKNLEGW